VRKLWLGTLRYRFFVRIESGVVEDCLVDDNAGYINVIEASWTPLTREDYMLEDDEKTLEGLEVEGCKACNLGC
jgi:hypothetical protein